MKPDPTKRLLLGVAILGIALAVFGSVVIVLRAFQAGL